MLIGSEWPLEFFRVRYSECTSVAKLGDGERGKGEARVGGRQAASRNICIRLDRRPLTLPTWNPRIVRVFNEPATSQSLSDVSKTMTQP